MTNLFRPLITVSGFTAISRVLGYVRDKLIASYLGASDISDAFFLALRLPNLFRRLFAEGAFNAAFVPLFSKLYYDQPQKGISFLHLAQTYLGLILCALVLFFEIFMPQLISIIGPGFKSHALKFHMAIEFSRITFPYILFIAMAALLAGVLNTLNRFAAATAAPIILNIFTILALVFLESHTLKMGYGLSIAVCLAGIAQLIWVLVATHQAGIPIKFVKPSLSPEVKELFQKMAPGILGAGVYQFNMLISDIIASFIPSAISYLAFADRINQLPLSMIGIAMGTVLLPLLTTHFHKNDIKAALKVQNQAIQVALLLSLPAAIALVFISYPIIQVLFEGGKFTKDATYATAMTLSGFALGLPAYVLIKVLNANFFARKDTTTPVKMASLCLVLNVLLNMGFAYFWGYVGIAIATAISSWINMVMLASILYKQQLLLFDKITLKRVFKIIISSIFMGIILCFANKIIKCYLPFLNPYFYLLSLVGTGFLSYFCVLYITKAIPKDFIKKII